MTSQFDALSQLFEQITERLIRIETKLDGKADLNVVGALEARIRDTELTVAKKDALIQEIIPWKTRIDDEVRRLTDREGRATAVEGFQINSRAKRIAAVTLGAGWLFSLVQAVIDITHRGS